MQIRTFIKFIVDFCPLIVFFLLYKFYGIRHATIGIMVATLMTTLVSFYLEKKISYLPFFTFLLIAVFGGITIYSGDTKFIKMKPTAINLLFFFVLMGGVMMNKGLLQYIFSQSLQMSEKSWIIFSKRWALFFLFVAGLNELIWRNFSENFWVNFKVFGILLLTFTFLLTQLKFISQHKIEESNN